MGVRGIGHLVESFGGGEADEVAGDEGGEDIGVGAAVFPGLAVDFVDGFGFCGAEGATEGELGDFPSDRLADSLASHITALFPDF